MDIYDIILECTIRICVESGESGEEEEKNHPKWNTHIWGIIVALCTERASDETRLRQRESIQKRKICICDDARICADQIFAKYLYTPQRRRRRFALRRALALENWIKFDLCVVCCGSHYTLQWSGFILIFSPFLSNAINSAISSLQRCTSECTPECIQSIFAMCRELNNSKMKKKNNLHNLPTVRPEGWYDDASFSQARKKTRNFLQFLLSTSRTLRLSACLRFIMQSFTLLWLFFFDLERSRARLSVFGTFSCLKIVNDSMTH